MAERYSRISRLSDIRYSTLKLKTDIIGVRFENSQKIALGTRVSPYES